MESYLIDYFSTSDPAQRKLKAAVLGKTDFQLQIELEEAQFFDALETSGIIESVDFEMSDGNPKVRIVYATPSFQPLKLRSGYQQSFSSNPIMMGNVQRNEYQLHLSLYHRNERLMHALCKQMSRNTFPIATSNEVGARFVEMIGNLIGFTGDEIKEFIDERK